MATPLGLVMGELRSHARPSRRCRQAQSEGSRVVPTTTDPASVFSAIKRNVQLRHSDEPKTRIKLIAYGEALVPPALPLGLPLRVQLQSSEGLCWEAVYTDAQKNEPDRFKAKTL